ncbi:MAG: hypothetical protein H5T49_03730 [Hadesarchaea archaeon]|nr:hypothetical protein [Hadesarchaea archaeon]
MQNSEPERGSRKVSLRLLKQFAAELPASALLRELLLNEPDELEPWEFLGRLSVWLQLSRRPEFFGFSGKRNRSVRLKGGWGSDGERKKV